MLNGNGGQTQISGYGWTCTILLKFGEVKWEKKMKTFALCRVFSHKYLITRESFCKYKSSRKFFYFLFVVCCPLFYVGQWCKLNIFGFQFAQFGWKCKECLFEWILDYNPH